MSGNDYPEKSQWPVPSGFCVSVMNAIESGLSAKEAFKVCGELEKENNGEISDDEPESWD